jgi:hypothetical protein
VPPVIRKLTRPGDDVTASTLVFSTFTMLKGVGNITAGPVSDALLKIDVLKGAVGAYGIKNYGVLLIYTGVVTLSGGAAGLAFGR